MSRARRALRVLLRRAGRVSLVALAIACAGLLCLAAYNPRLVVALGYWSAPSQYVVPVAGIEARQLRSTWGAPRSGGRTHRGVDIFAKKGTPVVSATDGVVWKVGSNALGGRVVWVVGDGHAAYYYAHLDTWRAGLAAGDRVAAGDLLGTVGNTGNARTTPPHLHFGVYPIPFGAGGTDPVPLLAKAKTVTNAEAIASARDDGRRLVVHHVPAGS